MELIHADGNMNELRFIDSFTKFDACISIEGEIDNNSWLLSMPVECYTAHPIEKGEYIYIEDTEWGGPVEKIRHNSTNRTVEISGVCWRGLLLRAVIKPNAGETHLQLTASDGNVAISMLLGSRMNNIFEVSNYTCPMNYFHSFRYATLLDGLTDSLEEQGYQPDIKFTDGRAIISAVPITDHSDEIEFSSDWNGDMISETGCLGGCNHILALGSGEMLERQVVELWLLPDGSITDDSTSEGIPSENDLRTYLYDYSAVESEDELINYAKRKLREYSASSSFQFTLEDSYFEMQLGDIVGARDYVTGLAQKLRIKEKILTIDSNGISLRYSMKTI